MTSIIESCVGTILSFLVEPVITHGAYVIQYKSKVQQLEQENKKLREKKERIQGMVDIEEKNYGRVIEPEVSSWLEEVKQMERSIANFLCQQENREQMERDNIANFLRQQENGEQMERDFSNILRQQENGESFKCFLGCMCPNLMWRHKRGMKADNRKEDVNKLIIRGELLQTSQVARDSSFQSEPLFDSSKYYTTFQSRASVVDEINNALKDSGVDMIGVHGPGGAGKTTMVKEVAKEAKKRGIFDEIVMAVVSKDPNTSKLQEELASQLRLKCEQRSELGKVLLNGKRRILVILDDLWQVPVLNAIGIPISGLGDRGCKILLTSRNEEVFRWMEVRSCVRISCVRLEYLEEQETWELFKKVIDGDFPVNESTARKVCKRCGDLPVAIVAVGAALKGKDDYVWWDALNQLKSQRVKYIEGKVFEGYTPLKLSYDFLEEADAKSCFLLCCLFPEDAEIPIDDLVRYSFALRFLSAVSTLKDARYRVQVMIDTLKRSCLLLNGKKKNFVKMHDVIRDIAISITKERQIEHGGGQDWPGKQQFIVDHDIPEWPKNVHHTAISLRIDKDKIRFPRGVHCPLMHTLVLESVKSFVGWESLNSSGKHSPKIPNVFFKGMKQATVLDFKNIVFRLPSSVLKLDHLRMLHLNYCLLQGNWSTIRKLRNHIEILSFKGSSIKEFPQEIGKLTRLRSLDLRASQFLWMIPKGVISNLICLEELYVLHDFKEWDTTIIDDDGRMMNNASIDELKSLNQLTVLHVGISTNSYMIMVQEWRNLFEKLNKFSIHISDDDDVDDDDDDDDDDDGDGSLNVLKIFNIQDIDEFCPLMKRVEKLRLKNIEDLRYLCGKPQLQFTPGGERSFSKLINLDISKCHSMKYLFSPSSAKALQQLKTLHVRDCSRMEQIIGVADHLNEEGVVDNEAIIFNQLEKISLLILPQFRSFYPKMEKTTIEGNLSNWTTITESIFNEKVSFPVLEDLTIADLSVEDIWNKQMFQFPERSNKVSFSQLKHIEVGECPNLVNVFPSNMLPRLQNLERLFVIGCPSLTLLVEDLNPNIQSPSVKFKFINVFSKLRYLSLQNLPKLMKIWLNDEDYCSYDNSINLYLKYISISHCDSWRHAFSSFVARYLVCIEELHVQACPRLEVIVSEAKEEGAIDDGIIKFCQLKILDLKYLPNLKSFSQSNSESSHLFNHQASFPVLEDLNIDELSVENIWNNQTFQFPEGSNKVSFSQLKHIVVDGCHNLVNVFPSNMPPRLQNLEQLVVIGCPSLTFLFEDLNPNIQNPRVKFKLIDVFPKLRYLWLSNLPKLMKIWLNDEDYCSNDNYVHLYLEIISIRDCGSLRHAFSALVARHLACIKELHVQACPEMEVIVSETRGEGVIDDGIINFCELERLTLEDLPNLKSFSQSKSEASHLFNQVTFPKIKYVALSDLKSSREIQLWDLPTTTQEHLPIVKIFRCQVSTKVSSHHQKQSSRTIINHLLLNGCWGFKHVIDLNGTISIGEEQFVDVKELTLHFLPELVLLWNKNLHEIWSLRSLKDIIIENCSQLKSLLMHSMATTLRHLENLSVISCEMIEEIIIIEENNINFAGKEKATRHIEFPKLKGLFLNDLPNLKNFCNDERGSFSFSSLHNIVVKKCPKMKTFASGQICLPPRMIQARVGYEKVEITDLNAFFESRNEDNNHRIEITI